MRTRRVVITRFGGPETIELHDANGFLPTLARIVLHRIAPRGRRATFYGIGGRLGREDPTVWDDLAHVLELAARGGLTPVIGSRLPLAEAARAHDLKERGGPAGKILLVPGAA